MPDFITESGYVEMRDLRPKVGAPTPETPRVVLLDLASHNQHDLSLDFLPGLKDDPLKDLRAKAEAAKKERAAKAEKTRSPRPTRRRPTTKKADDEEG